MKKRFAILLTLLAALLLCGCGEKADEQRWLWSSEEITPPSDFGYVLTVASTEDEVFAVSHTALGRYENGEITVLDTIYSADAPAMVYGSSGYGDTLYLLAGEMRPQYTENGEPRENPDFSGKYTVIAYRSGARAEAVSFQLSESDVLSGLLALSDEYMLCWTATDAWVVSLAEGGSVYPQQVSGEIVAPTTSRSGMWLWVKQGETFGFYPLTATENALGGLTQPEDCPRLCTATVSRNDGCLLNSGGTLSLYQPGRNTDVPLANWHDCALADATVTSIVQCSDNTWLCASDFDGKIWSIRREVISEGKQTLHIAAAVGSLELDELVKQFNRAHRDCVAVIDYYPENAYDRLCTEMMAGDGPDVLDLTWLSLPLNSSYLVDLYPYIDADPDVDRDMFVPTVISSLELNGQLTSLPAAFVVLTMTARVADVGERTDWTIEELQNLWEQRTDDIFLMSGWMDRHNYLSWLATLTTGDFIDWENGTARYDSEDFIRQLQFCETLSDYVEYNDEVAEKPCLVEFEDVQNLVRINGVRYNYKEDFTYIGFPGDGEYGSFFDVNQLHFAISANSDKKDLAWEFIRLALTKKNQEMICDSWQLPIRMDVMDARIETVVGNVSDRQRFRQLIQKPLRFVSSNDTIHQIVTEEGEAYFDGQRTVEEAAERIQNRVTLYLSEIE